MAPYDVGSVFTDTVQYVHIDSSIPLIAIHGIYFGTDDEYAAKYIAKYGVNDKPLKLLPDPYAILHPPDTIPNALFSASNDVTPVPPLVADNTPDKLFKVCI